MNGWPDHLIIAPILLPLVASALILLFGEGRRPLRRAIAIATALALLAISIALIDSAAHSAGPRIYRLGNWPTPFAITLVLDRLSALMLLL